MRRISAVAHLAIERNHLSVGVGRSANGKPRCFPADGPRVLDSGGAASTKNASSLNTVRSSNDMRTVLICHDDAPLHRKAIARWLASFSILTGIVVIREGPDAIWRRGRRELRRVGALRFADTMAFRLYYKLFIARDDEAWEQRTLARLCERYPAVPAGTSTMVTSNPNSSEAEQFIRQCEPDVVLALCKVLLKPGIFSIPSRGTFVLHPGTCPEYRNAHGCFWALANDDLDKVATTLLRIDAGVDTGPVYGYYHCAYDEIAESHIVIQHRTVLDNLDGLRQKLAEIADGVATPIDTAGRRSATWGQPWLTSYLKWKRRARERRASESARTALS